MRIGTHSDFYLFDPVHDIHMSVRPHCPLLLSLMHLQLYGKRAAWEDPSKWVNNTYPWNAALLQQDGQSLLQLRPEDVGYEGYSSSKEGASSKQVSQSDTEGDPLVRDSKRTE